MSAACLLACLTALAPTIASAGWSPATDISPEGESTFEGGPQIAVGGPGRAVAVWTQRQYSDRIQAAAKLPNGTWGQPVDLGPHGEESFAPQVAMNEAGEAVAVWVHRGEKFTVETAAMTPQGTWTQPSGLSVPGGALGYLDVVIDETGRSTAIWDHLDQSNSSTYVIEAATRPPGGSWEGPIALTDDDNNAWSPKLAVDGHGRVVAAWAHYTDDGNHTYIEAAEMSPAGAWGEPEEISDRAGRPFVSDVAAGGDRAVVLWTLGDLVEGAYRDAGGPWKGPVGVPGSEPTAAAVAISQGGDALAIWSDSDEGQVVKTATLPGGASSWTKPLEVSAPQLVETTEPDVAVDPAGEATAVWTGWDGQNRLIESASGSVNGGWAEPVVISPPEVWADRAQVDGDAGGDAAAVWRGLAKHQTIQSAVLDRTGPELDPVSIPATGRAGVPLSFAASPFDAWSPTGPVSWGFGDGSVATGAAVSHAYPDAGRFQVTATVSDATGLPKTVSALVEVSPALAVADRIAVVKKGTVRLTLSCPGVAECHGNAALSVRAANAKGKGRTRSIATTRFTVPAGGESTVTARLSDWGLERFRSTTPHRLPAQLTGSAVEARPVILKPSPKTKPRSDSSEHRRR